MSIFDQFRLDGQVALITGSGKGIGAGIARTFAEAGADIVLSARTETDLKSVAADIEAMGRKALIVPTDVMNDVDRDRLIDACFEEFGRLDILVNNTGGTAPGPALDSSIEIFEKSFRFNVSTAFDMSIKCAPRMVEMAGGGCIINISSIAGHKPTPCFSVYGTSKG
ncbi:SDR family NAD(P)-dependent oxidoreductase, partial [Halieaceae bacterium]|nr:SDR family NAD(P)-dependent oxidoreductase [Halieaceae bacterium]